MQQKKLGLLKSQLREVRSSQNSKTAAPENPGIGGE